MTVPVDIGEVVVTTACKMPDNPSEVPPMKNVSLTAKLVLLMLQITVLIIVLLWINWNIHK